MSEANIQRKVKEIMKERLFLDVEPEDIDEEKPITEQFEVDSIQLFEIILGCQEVFGIEFEDDEFNIESFRTVKTIAELVRTKLTNA